MKKWILPCLFTLGLFSLAACSNNNDEEEAGDMPEEPGLRARDSLRFTEGDALAQLRVAFNDPSLSWKQVSGAEEWKDDSLRTVPFTAPPDFFRNYAQKLRWSPDSAYVLDIGTYGSVLTRDRQGNNRVEAGEPDSEVAVIDVKNKKRTRVLYMGPSGEILNGFWLDSAHVAVAALFDETGEGRRDSLLWIVNVKDNWFRKYQFRK